MGGSLARIAASRGKHARVDMRDRVGNVPPQIAHLSRGVMRDVRAGEPDPSAGRLFELEMVRPMVVLPHPDSPLTARSITDNLGCFIVCRA
jgi:hypothetical protein